ncbi:MAG: hypothetical protein GY776_05025 [Alteromonas sp.]|nr:hypothetical protein [Alteromonas sp.]
MATTFELNVSRIPAGTYTMVLDKADGTRAFRGDVVFGGQTCSVDLPALNDGELLKGYVDDGLMVVRRAAYIEGTTAPPSSDSIGELYNTVELFNTVEIHS